MENHGTAMPTDSASLRRSSRELSDQLPTIPRRNSNEDRDTSKPRKRLAGMGSRPQSPMAVDDDDNAQPEKDPKEPTPSTELSSELSSHTLADDGTASTTTSTVPVKRSPSGTRITIRVPVAREDTAGEDLPSAVESQDGDEDKAIHSSALYSDEPNFARSPELVQQVQELDESDEQDLPVLDAVEEDTPPLPRQAPEDTKAILELVSKELTKKENPSSILISIYAYIGEWITTAEDYNQFQVEYRSNPDIYDHLPKVVDLYLRRVDNLSAGFFRRQAPDQKTGPELTMEFFAQYAQLVVKMMSIDLQTLLNAPDDSPPTLFSASYANVLHLLLRPDTPLIQLFRRSSDSDYSKERLAIASVFASSHGGLMVANDILGALFSRVKKTPVLFGYSTHYLEMTVSLLSLCLRLGKSQSRHAYEEELIDLSARVVKDAKEIYNTYDINLKRLVETLAPTTNLKDIIYASDMLTNVAMETVSLDYEQLNDMFGKQIGDRYEDMLPHDIPDFAQWSCRYPLLLKMMTTNRLEVRLHGVQKMSDVILKSWIDHNRNANSVYLRYIGDVLEEKKVIEYITGPETHPEMTKRSNNILCFLIVMDRFTPALREVVWQPILEGKDTRTAQQVLELIADSLQHSSYELCLDYCLKASKIPPSAFNQRIIQFLPRLLEATKRTYQNLDRIERHEALDEAPYQLLGTAIKIVATPEDELQSTKTPINHAVSMLRTELSKMINIGPDMESQRKIIAECVDDIRSLRPCVTGSMVIYETFMKHIIQACGLQLAAELINEQGFLELFVQEIAHFVKQNSGRDSNYISPHLTFRLDLLNILVWYFPESFTEELSKPLWDNLIGSSVVGQNERDLAFNYLKTLLEQRPPSPLIERFVLEYFPNLNVSYITLSALAWLKAAVVQFNGIGRVEVKDGLLQIKGMDQIWRVILTSPDAVVSKEAINFMVTYYLDYCNNVDFEGEKAMEPHFQLLETCIENVKASAPPLEESEAGSPGAMSIDLNEEDQQRVLKFDRSVAALTSLITAYKMRPQFAMGRRGSTANSANQGERMRFNMALHVPDHKVKQYSVELWSNDPAEYLHDRISRAIGTQNYRCILLGREIPLRNDQQKLLKDFNFRETNSLMISSRGILKPEDQPPIESAVTPLESKVLEHFDELYALLGLEEPYGRSMYDILIRLPPHDKVSSLFAKEGISDDILPRGHPWQIYYFTNSLRNRLRGPQDTNFTEGERVALISSATRLLLKGLLLDDISGVSALSEARAPLTDGYLKLCNELVKQAVGLGALEECAEGFLGYISALLKLASNAATQTHLLPLLSGEIINISLEILFGCMKANDTNWDEFKDSEGLEQLLLKLLVEDARPTVRWSTANQIVMFVGSNLRDSEHSDSKYLLFFWEILFRTIPMGAKYPSQTSELYEATRILFDLVVLHEPSTFDTRVKFVEWASLVVNYGHPQTVGNISEDFFLVGMSKLLVSCFEAVDDPKDVIDCCKELMVTVFQHFLFTPLSSDLETPDAEEVFPILDRQTRGELYNLITTLIKTVGGGKIANMLIELFPTDGDVLREGWALDRNRWIISPAGFVGLKNLSNTCYLNSLITQLFMNVEFRDFMLEFPIEDDDRQSLIFALKMLFAQMQAGTLKAADPGMLASAIRDHENNEIDVSVQMDVDEFFNLLFDRIEGQIPNGERKNAFKAIYGGQLVQQVKSKECPHVSEREEPFSAIQCDIKGKHSLVESMQAYVEGEVMEGDNKYKCSKCDKHVDAVKRSCLKTIPDNLIFHLKRFDFDLETMLRRKINDQFEFPEEIDMKPYTMDYSETNAEPDMFELCGVLVHTGTAESGHYYSYIKNSQNPKNAMGAPNWLQFNDSEVSVFDYNQLSECCYGGVYGGELGTMMNQTPRPYSAYMLFYKRKNTDKEMLEPRKKDTHISAEIREDILMENERIIRDYCMFDDEFVGFVHQVVEITHEKDGSERHARGSTATVLAITTLQQIVARMKEYPGSDAIFKYIIQAMAKCLPCATSLLTWVTDNDGLLKTMLLRCPNQRTRANFGAILIYAMQQHRLTSEGRKAFYGVEDMHSTENIEDIVSADPGSIAHSLIGSLCKMMKNLQHLMRPWDDYFDLLVKIACTGLAEVALLLNENALESALELFYTDFPSRNAQNVLRAFDRPRKPSMLRLLDFIRVMQQYINPILNDNSEEDEIFRYPEDGKFAATMEERHLLFEVIQKDNKPGFKFLLRQLELNIDVTQTKMIIAWWIQNYDAAPATRNNIKETLLSGINMDPADKAGPYLDCLLAYIELANSPAEVRDLIHTVADDVSTIHNAGGREHLSFFRALPEIRTQALGPSLCEKSVLETAPRWAPALLTYWEQEVRYDAFQLLEQYFFNHRDEETGEWESPMFERLAETMCREVFNFVEKKFFPTKDLIQGADAKTFDIVVRVLELCKDPNTHLEHARRIQDIKNMLNSYLEEEMEFGSDEWNVSDFGSDSQLVADDDST